MVIGRTISTPHARITSGIAGLDTILLGGFRAGSTYMIAGQPGAGKTIFSNQLCFHHVAKGGRAVYVSLVTETHDRLFTHLESLTFFDRNLIGQQLYYVSGLPTLTEHGWRGLLDFVRKIVRDQQATMLVIDGLTLADVSADTPFSFVQFLQHLQASMAANDCTSFLVTHLETDAALAPIHAMTDGIIELTNRRQHLRALREIEVRKFRGSGYLEGRHQMAITDAGIVVYPRTEQVLAQPRFSENEPPERVPWGVTELDRMTEGGLLRDSMTVVLGPSGSGKTVLGLHFLGAGVQRKERSLLFGFYESPPGLRRKARSVGVPLDAAIEAGHLHIIWQPPLENSIDALAERLLAAVEQQGIRRLFIDGIDGFCQATDDRERLPRFFTALSQELRARRITTLVTMELETLFGPTVQVPLPNVSVLVENLVFLRYLELRSQLYRLISILKMRESGYDASIREFRITSQGIDIATTFESAEAILTGIARPHGDQSQ